MSTFIPPTFTLKKYQFQKKFTVFKKEGNREQWGATSEYSSFSTLLVSLSIHVTILKLPVEGMIKGSEGEVATGHLVGNLAVNYPIEYKS